MEVAPDNVEALMTQAGRGFRSKEELDHWVISVMKEAAAGIASLAAERDALRAELDEMRAHRDELRLALITSRRVARARLRRMDGALSLAEALYRARRTRHDTRSLLRSDR